MRIIIIWRRCCDPAANLERLGQHYFPPLPANIVELKCSFCKAISGYYLRSCIHIYENCSAYEKTCSLSSFSWPLACPLYYEPNLPYRHVLNLPCRHELNLNRPCRLRPGPLTPSPATNAWSGGGKPALVCLSTGVSTPFLQGSMMVIPLATPPSGS